MRPGIAVLLLVCLWICAPAALRAGDPEPARFQWQVGEELFYKVKYSFLSVGSLHFWVLEKDTLRGRPVYHCKLHMKSSPAIPFVSMDDYYESYIDEDVYSHIFWSYEKQKDHQLMTRYDTDYDAGVIKIRIEKQFAGDTVVVLDSAAAINGKVQDGLSLLFYARAEVKKNNPRDVAVFAFNRLRDTFINFTGRTEEVKAKGAKVEGYYLDGKMKFVGIAGIKEDFKGWFSPDAQSVPLHAKMKAFLGSVRLNLHWWKNWSGDTVLGDNAAKGRVEHYEDDAGDEE